MNDALPVFVVLAATAGMVPVISRNAGREGSLIIPALLVQVLAAIVHVVIVREYYGYGDMLAYWRSGVRLAQGVEVGQVSIGSLLALVFQLDNDLFVSGNGRSTGSMHGIAGLLCLVFGSSLFAICMAIAVAGFLSRFWMFLALRTVWPTATRGLTIAVFWMPSAIFWSAALLKEGVAMPGLALASGALVRMLHARRPMVSMLLLTVPGLLAVGVSKPYLLAPLALSVAAGAFVRSRSTFSSLPVAVAVVAGIVLLGAMFPRYAISSVVDSAEEVRSLGASHAGSSTFSLPSGGLSVLLPLGVATALFRPLLFEVRSLLLLLSALEMLTISVVLVRNFGSFGGVWRLLCRNWMMASSAVFVLVFSVALGLSATNLGTLARYRAPMMPYYGILLVGLFETSQRRRAALQSGVMKEYFSKAVGSVT